MEEREYGPRRVFRLHRINRVFCLGPLQVVERDLGKPDVTDFALLLELS